MPKGESTGRPTTGPVLVPSLMFKSGRVMLPGPDGPVVARTVAGAPYDLLDVVDHLTAKFSRLFVVDLEGVERARPQLDYLQEICRDAEVWVDGGVRDADQAIDILLTGAHRAVLSTGLLRGPKEVKRAWKMSPNLAFEIETVDGAVRSPGGEWNGSSPDSIAGSVVAIGVQDLIYSPREADVNWSIAAGLSRTASVWVDGTFRVEESRRLAEAGASGGIFHIDQELEQMPVPATATPAIVTKRSAKKALVRDDDT